MVQSTALSVGVCTLSSFLLLLYIDLPFTDIKVLNQFLILLFSSFLCFMFTGPLSALSLCYGGLATLPFLGYTCQVDLVLVPGRYSSISR